MNNTITLVNIRNSYPGSISIFIGNHKVFPFHAYV